MRQHTPQCVPYGERIIPLLEMIDRSAQHLRIASWEGWQTERNEVERRAPPPPDPEPLKNELTIQVQQIAVRKVDPVPAHSKESPSVLLFKDPSTRPFLDTLYTRALHFAMTNNVSIDVEMMKPGDS